MLKGILQEGYPFYYAQLREELEDYKKRKNAGRKKHNSKWTESYNDFVIKYESGMTIVEIVSEGKISRRTAYRYKAYYDEMKKIVEEIRMEK